MPSADIVFYNANILTLDPGYPKAEMAAVRDGKILLVGDSGEVQAFKGLNTRLVDCGGKTLVPGFDDAHCHILVSVRSLLNIDISPASVSSIEDVKAVIKKQAQKTEAGGWIMGANYNEFYFAEGRHPTRYDIDEVSPDNPVVLAHRSLHACVLNSRALKLAGITGETPEPPGAFIDRDIETGEPNGVLHNMLGYIWEGVIPAFSEVELARGMELANEHYLSQGLTSIQDATIKNDMERWQLLKKFKENGTIKSRISMMGGTDFINEFIEAGMVTGYGDNQLRLGSIKIMTGLSAGGIFPSQDELNQKVYAAHSAGFQVAIHTIEEKVLEAVVTAMEYALVKHPRAGSRHRIAHCAECPPHLLPRIARLGAVVVTQPPFIYYSGERYLATVPPDKLQWLYRMRTLVDNGIKVAFSSDAPVVNDNPLIGIQAAVTRKAETGQVVLPGERLTVEEALAGYTLNAAYASFEEDIKGSISPGKLADIVLLSANPYASPPEGLKDIKVEMTVIGGDIVWEI